MKLYTYFRSSAAWRVRIALALKGIACEAAYVHLLKDGGQQHGPEYRRRNPAGLVPILEPDQGPPIAQSLAIIEWLEERYPEPALLPQDPAMRAQVRAFALTIACDIHPIDNLRVLQYLERQMAQSKGARDDWYRHWVAEGLGALEAMLQGGAGPFCYGPSPTLADLCLVPQLYNARRFACPLDAYPTLLRAEAAASALPAFRYTAPERQPDAT